jgi:5-methylcytosine-specific restriction endonuclease McrA
LTDGPPSADAQIAFLRNVQRILSEGSFVATYKYALLHSLADLAILRGDDSGALLRLSTNEIAERFVELYWLQGVSFQGKGRLRQNAGRPAAILNRIEDVRNRYRGSLARLRRDVSSWRPLIRDVANTVRVMPLWKLQTVGRSSLPFLYENVRRGSEIELLPGVAYCLRAHHSLLVDLIRGAWIRYVRRHNAQVLGEGADLYSFLFGQERDAGLFARCAEILREAQQGRCLYCEKTVSAEGQVDHFVPWALYPIDLGHNLVLAHSGCNLRKSDHLAAENHLESWLARTREHGATLEVEFDTANVLYDRAASERIAAWAYAQVETSRGLVWRSADVMEPLEGRWRSLLVDSATAYPALNLMDGAALAADRPAWENA